MLTYLSLQIEPSVGVEVPPQLPQSPVDDVMQDFACNGYICDELNRYHLGIQLSNAAAAAGAANNATGPVAAGANSTSLLTAAVNQHQNGLNAATTSAGINPTVALTPQQLQQLQQHTINLNFNNNFWKMLPAHMQQHSQAAVTAAVASAAAATAAAAVNMDYNCNQNKKTQKRYNGPKNDKYVSNFKTCFLNSNFLIQLV